MSKKKVKVVTKYRTRKELPRMYETQDQILPSLALPDPVEIKLIVTATDVKLFIGPRDWQWDRKSGDMIGAGTCIISDSPEPEPTK